MITIFRQFSDGGTERAYIRPGRTRETVRVELRWYGADGYYQAGRSYRTELRRDDMQRDIHRLDPHTTCIRLESGARIAPQQCVL